MIVFSFMQEDSRTEENYLVTNKFDSEEELLDEWLGSEEDEWGFMSYGLVDEDGEPVSEELMKEILTGGYNGVEFEAHDGEVYYTFSVTHTK